MREKLRRAVSWLLSSEGSLSEEVFRGGLWSAVSKGSHKLVKLGRTAILAQILGPSAFGIIALAVLATRFATQFTDLGINPALIQRPEENVDKFINTAWTTRIVRGVILFVGLLVTAPYIAQFFDSPQLQPVIRVFSLSMLLTGLRNPAVVYYRKNIDIHKQFAYNMSEAVVDFAVGVGLAFLLGNVWALVFGMLAGQSVRVLWSFRYTDYVPSLSFERERAEGLLGFGKWMWATGIVSFLATSGDDAFVGWLLTSTALGYYSLAFRFSNLPLGQVTSVVNNTLFPALSQLQDDTERLRSGFLKSLYGMLLILTPAAVGMIIVAPGFIVLLLGKTWKPMIVPFQILVGAGYIRSLAGLGATLFKSYGIPRWTFHMNAVRAGVIGVTIWPLTTRFGVPGAALSVTLGICATLPLMYVKIRDVIEISSRDYFRALFIPVVASGIMFFPVYAIAGQTPDRLTIAVSVGIISYSVCTYVLLLRSSDPHVVYFRSKTREYIRKIRGNPTS